MMVTELLNPRLSRPYKAPVGDKVTTEFFSAVPDVPFHRASAVFVELTGPVIFPFPEPLNVVNKRAFVPTVSLPVTFVQIKPFPAFTVPLSTNRAFAAAWYPSDISNDLFHGPVVFALYIPFSIPLS